MRNKKGTILDVFFISVFFLIIAITAVVGLKMWNEITPALEEHISPEGQDAINTMNVLFGGYDYILLILFFGLYISTLVGAFLIDTHPALFFISLLFLMVLGVLTAQMANMWEVISETSSLSAEAASLPMTNYVLRNLPLISIIMGMVLMIVLYSKTQTLGGSV